MSDLRDPLEAERLLTEAPEAFHKRRDPQAHRRHGRWWPGAVAFSVPGSPFDPEMNHVGAAASRSAATERLLGMSNHRFTIYESPIGPLTLTGDGAALTGLWFAGRGRAHDEADHRPEDFATVIDQLDTYFGGERRDFDLLLRPLGTPFQRRIWAHLERIPYGTTTTYGALAQRLGDEHGAWVSPRAVGSANGANPISIIVPCHRVIGSDGSLTGYGGGLPAKQALLGLEAGIVQGHAPRAISERRQIALR